jgi:hypothetical protein
VQCLWIEFVWIRISGGLLWRCNEASNSIKFGGFLDGYTQSYHISFRQFRDYIKFSETVLQHLAYNWKEAFLMSISSWCAVPEHCYFVWNAWRMLHIWSVVRILCQNPHWWRQ